jgi:ABC-type thiamin/hydroxymethylpyrimidine transport system permease subunit
VNFVGWEIDRKNLAKHFKPSALYKFLFYISIGVMIFAVIIGAVMNPQIVIPTLRMIQYIAAGIALVFVVSFSILKTYSSKPLPTDGTKEPAII